MDLAELIPVVAIIASACVTIAFLHFRHERAKLNAYGAGTTEGTRENARLVDENEMLRLTVDRLEERLAVLERIATDPAERTAREIERLR
jgi:regulator of replication initiation timing